MSAIDPKQTWGGADNVIGQVLERVMGIEPTYAAWEAAVLPLNYTRSLPVLAWWPQAFLGSRLGLPKPAGSQG